MSILHLTEEAYIMYSVRFLALMLEDEKNITLFTAKQCQAYSEDYRLERVYPRVKIIKSSCNERIIIKMTKISKS